MPQADAHDGHFAKQFLHAFRNALYAVWVARTIGQQYAVWFHGKYFRGSCAAWHHFHLEAHFRQLPQYVVLDAAVDDDHTQIPFLGPGVGLGRRHLLCAVYAIQTMPFIRLGDGLLWSQVCAVRMQPCLLGSVFTQVQHQAARIYICQDGLVRRLQQCVQTLGASPGGWLVQVLDDEAVKEYPTGFHVLIVAAVIAHFCCGKSHNLPEIRWVGHDFLVARHACVEDGLAWHVLRRTQ